MKLKFEFSQTTLKYSSVKALRSTDSIRVCTYTRACMGCLFDTHICHQSPASVKVTAQMSDCCIMGTLCLCHKGVKTVRTGWLSLVDQQSLLVERPEACVHSGWVTHIYHRVRACSHLPSSPAVSLTHLAHMTNGKITPDLRPLTKSWPPGSVKQNKSCFKFLFLLFKSSFYWSTLI